MSCHVQEALSQTANYLVLNVDIAEAEKTHKIILFYIFIILFFIEV